jgi:hypothetical protein
MSAPLSSKCVAKLWRGGCAVACRTIPTRRRERPAHRRLVQVVTAVHFRARIDRADLGGEHVLPAPLAPDSWVFHGQGLREEHITEPRGQVLRVQRPNPLEVLFQLGLHCIREHGAPVLAPLPLRTTSDLSSTR